MGYANLIKGKILKVKTDKLSRRWNLIGSWKKIPCQIAMHESGGDKWQTNIG
jgi:hypothetical protein